jgi:hypothetical protein
LETRTADRTSTAVKTTATAVRTTRAAGPTAAQDRIGLAGNTNNQQKQKP